MSAAALSAATAQLLIIRTSIAGDSGNIFRLRHLRVASRGDQACLRPTPVVESAPEQLQKIIADVEFSLPRCSDCRFGGGFLLVIPSPVSGASMIRCSRPM